MAGRGWDSRRGQGNQDQIRNTGATSNVNTGGGGGAQGDRSSSDDVSSVCHIRDKQVRDDDSAMKCNHCRKWHHIHCEGMEMSTYKVLVRIILRKVMYVVSVVAIIKQVIVPLMFRNVSIVSDRRGER